MNALNIGKPLVGFTFYNKRVEEELPRRLDSPVRKYSELEIIAKGGQGKIWKGKLEGKPVIIKVYQKEAYEFYKNEVKILTRLGSYSATYIPKLYDFYLKESTPMIVMEAIDGITLEAVIKRGEKLNPKVLYVIFLQLLLALKYIHSHNIVHNDLKSNNVMIDRYNNIKLIDFGYSCEGPETSKQIQRFVTDPITGTATMRTETMTVKTEYDLTCTNMFGNKMEPPELKTNQHPPRGSEKKFIYGRDVWGAGIIMFQLANLNNPIDENYKLIKSDYKLDDGRLNLFLDYFFKLDWEIRPTVDEAIAYMVYNIFGKL